MTYNSKRSNNDIQLAKQIENYIVQISEKKLQPDNQIDIEVNPDINIDSHREVEILEDYGLENALQLIDQTDSPLDQNIIRQIENLLKAAFPDTVLQIYPNGVPVFAYGNRFQRRINGVISRSPILNNNFYSVEQIDGKFLNIATTKIPNVLGQGDELSSAQIYVKLLIDAGLQVTGSGLSRIGSFDLPNDRGVITITHQAIGLNPIDFIKRTIAALLFVLRVIADRSDNNKQCPPKKYIQ